MLEDPKPCQLLVPATQTQAVCINKDELKAKTLEGLGAIFKEVRRLKPKNKSLTRQVAREASRCTREYKRMQQIVNETRQVVGQELDILAKRRVRAKQEMEE